MTDERDNAKEDRAAALVHADVREVLIRHAAGRQAGEVAACMSGMACALVEALWLGRKPGHGIAEMLDTWARLGAAFIKQAPVVWPPDKFPPGEPPVAEPLRVQVVEPDDPKARN